MASPGIVEALDEVEHVGTSLIALDAKLASRFGPALGI
jgi:hypothetical protein